ncbi:amino acid adenylation domain-containing protein [Streptomyces sp. NPDC002431]
MIYVTGAKTLVNHPAHPCVHEAFAAQAARTPDATALLFEQERVDYAQLHARAGALAGRLRAAGVGRGDVVGVYLPRGIALVAALLAVLRSGAAYTVLDPSHPAERLRTLCGLTGARTLLTGGGLDTDFAGPDVLLLDAEPAWAQDGAAPDALPDGSAEVRPEDPACVIFTSGSTGTPKGVVLPHRALVATLTGQDYAEFGPGEVWLQSAPVSWDAFATELFGPLLSGGTCVLQPGQTPDPDFMAELALRHGVTVLKASASLFNYLLDQHPGIFTGLTRAMTGGEAASVPHVTRALRDFPRVRLVNGYGPAESMGYTLAHRIGADDLQATSIPIGTPVAHKRAYVLDQELSPVADGETGELYVAGDGLALGYLGLAGLTADRFLADPFGEPGTRMYRTGDLARRRADGTLEFHGRVDDQVKIRGFRVEPAEIQNVLSGHPSVEQAAVVVREDAVRGTTLVAYTVGTATDTELRRYAEERLADYMVPSAFVALDELPRTPNGKLDRRALPAPSSADAPGRAPATEDEALICSVFAEVLGRETVGADSDFFRLGGHSLLAARAASAVRRLTGHQMSMRTVFDAPTAAELARHLVGSPALPEAATVPVRPAGARIPLSPAQTRLWITDQLAPDTAEYLVPVALRIRGTLDTPALETALRQLVARQESLRTRFVDGEQGPEQIIDPAPELRLSTTALADEGDLDSFVTAWASRPMDLAAGPVFRAVLGSLSASDHVLVLCLHHIVADDWSLAVLAEELHTLYARARTGQQPGPAPEVQCADIALWQSTLPQDPAHLAYWERELAAMPQVLELPTDRPRPRERDIRGDRVAFEVPAALVGRLRTAAQESGATLYMALLSGFEVLLSRWTGQRDFGVATPAAGREVPGSENLIGFFVNTLVMRARLEDSPSFTELLERVRTTALAGYEHQEATFDQVVEAVQPDRDLARNPLAQVVFALQTAATASWRLDGLTVDPQPARTSTSKFDLFCALEERGDGSLAGSIEYPVALFDATTVQRIAAHYTALLDALVGEPHRPVFSLPLLDEDAERALDALVNDTATDLGTLTVPALVTRQARLRPDATAVACEDARLTYAELDSRSDRLAHWLRARGVTAETPVAVCFERGLDVPVVLLGVLKAGGCYVPLDADYPADRLTFMLQDTGAPLVIAQRDTAPRLPVSALVWEDIQDELAQQPAGPPRTAVDPGQLAYVMYTSGSTGRPKGVEISHRSVVRLVHRTNFTELTPDEVLLLLAPLSFDASTLELWGALCNGARLAVFPPGIPTPDRLRDTVRRHGVTVMWLTAGLFHSVVEEDPQALAGLRHLITGGDVVSAEHVARLTEATGTRVGDGYGPTECTTFTCVKREIPATCGTVPIGPPITNTRVYVLDEHLNRVPVGVPGELMVSGPGLARGYRDRAGLTAERFVANPYEPGERMYRTGDLVRVLDNGDLEFVGRADRQVKIRGFRIEPGEVENRLEEHPAVERAVVLVREDIPGDKRLVGYLSGDTAALTAGVADLPGFCREALPSYMVPTAFVPLDAFPLDPNGKVHRAALPAPERYIASGASRTPRTPTEEVMAGIWGDVLGVTDPGVDDDFFTLGGHSLYAIKIVSRIRKLFACDLTVRDLFRTPTIALLAAELDARTGAAADGGARWEPVPVHEGEAPLSPAQSGLWFADRFGAGSSEYLIARALRLTGQIDLPALRAALDTVVARHEPLRTRFPERDGRPVQEVDPAGPVPLTVEDVTDQDAFVRSQVDRPCDLASGPVFRAALGRVADEEHILLLCVHHIAADGASVRLLAQEISEAYTAHRAGRAPAVPELATRYRDVAAWQAARTGDIEHWRAALADMPQVVEMPADHQRPAVRDVRGALHTFTIPGEVGRRVSDLAHSLGATPFMVLMGAFQVLVRRFTGAADFAVGTPVAGREHPDTEALIGHFVNTVVLRADLHDEPDFATLVGRVRENTLAALDHQDVPFDKVVEELQPARDLSRNPLVQLVFALQTGTEETWTLDGLTAEPLPVHSRTSKFDLFLALREEADGSLSGSVEYPVSLFDEASVVRLAGHYATLLGGLVDAPHTPVTAVPMLTAEDHHHLVWETNDTAVAYPRGDTLHGLIAEQVARTPDAVAVEYGDERLSYAELDRWANGIALRLRALGVGPDVAVGVRMDRSVELMAGLLAVLKAGGCYVPIETDTPDARALGILQDAGAPVCLVNPGAPVPATDRTVFVEVARASADAPPEVALDPDHLVSIYYTSGSTGRPKGVASTHEGWVNRMRWMQDAYALRPDESVLQKTTLVFDDSAVEVFWPLIVGARVVLIEPGLHRDPAAILDAAIRHRVAVLQFVPSMLTLFLEGVEPRHRAGLAPLRHVISSGEALTPELLKLFMERLDGAVLHNQWGATEVSIDSTARHCSAADTLAPGSVSVGSPIANNEVHVLDEYLAPVPTGVAGDLYIGGIGLARGYHGDAAKTAAAFLPSPFSPGERLYRTGDRGLRLPDGSILFLGRQDDQVKIRGIRVEPGEVEQALLEVPGVREAAVTVRVSETGDKSLAGYVVPAAGEELAPADLRAALRDRLPSYMVPATLTVLPEFPTTTSGKTDRRRLPEPDQADGSTAGYQAPEGVTAELVAEIWAEVLGLPRVGAHDNFFDLGGHSLLAVRMLSQLRRRTGAEIPIRAVFESPTVAEIADVVLHAARAEQEPIPRREPGDTVPLADAQVGIWFADQLNPEAIEYLVPLSLRIRGPLDRTALASALTALVARHEPLRTRIVTGDGEPVQRVDPAAPVALPLTELADEDGVRAFLHATTAGGVDLARGPLFRAALGRLSATEHILSLVVHHIVSDGWSTAVLADDLHRLYTAALRGDADGGPAPLPVSYGDYALWQRTRSRDEGLDHWRAALDGMPQALELPTDRPRPAERDVRGEVCEFTVPAATVRRLAALGQTQGATLFMTLMAGFQALVGRYTGQRDFGLTTPVAGRDRPEIEALIGQFVNTLVLRADLAGNPDFTELLARVRRTTLDAYEHQDVPFDRVVEALQPARDVTRNPLAQVAFALQTASTEAWRLADLDVAVEPTHTRTSKFDLSFGLRHTDDGGLHGTVEYQCALYDRATVERMTRHYVTLLDRLATDPGAPVQQLSFLSDTEAERLDAVNDTAYDIGSWTVPTLVARRARERPDTVAVAYGDARLTYAELAARSDRLAAYLRDAGVGPETAVGVCFERGLDVPVVLLGVLKAGGYYIPIDAEYPADRISYMLADSEASLVITQRALVDRLPVEAVVWEDIRDVEPDPGTPPRAPLPDQLAYMIYTSGSTGRPKGVQITHRGIVALVHGAGYAGLGPDEVHLLISSLSFDTSMFDIWGALCNGAGLAVFPPGVPTADAVQEVIEEHGVTVSVIPTGLFNLLADQRPEAFARMRQALVGGEALSVPPARAVAALGVDVTNAYGPTECTVIATVQRNVTEGDGPVSIGPPVTNTRVYVLDPYLNRVPAGVPGELMLAGPGLARGYHGRRGMTAERFVANPFEPGERMYRTGDLVRMLPGGELEFLGRADRQVKIRGFRIEPGDIESRLAQHPDVHQVLVHVREDVPGDRRLVAYLVCGTPPPGEQLRAFCREELPDHMVPAAFVALDAFPLDPNGKVLRSALPAPDWAGLSGSYVAPRTDAEEAIAEIWSSVLGIEHPGVHSDFFDIGGHSLLASRVRMTIQARFDIDLPMRTFFKATTITALARAVEQHIEAELDGMSEQELLTTLEGIA